MEPDILTEKYLILRTIHSIDNILPHTIIQKSNLLSQLFLKVTNDWPHGVFHVFFAIGSAQVGQDNQGFRVIA